MELDARKKKILQAVVDDYVKTAEPVGSRFISKRHDLGLSSATIRNEMSDLSEMGYLEQPHTSSGRIPSYLGYRFYVDKLMSEYSLSLDEIKKIQQCMEIKIREFNTFIEQVSEVVSKLTNHASIVLTSEMKKRIIKGLKLIPVDSSNMMLVLLAQNGIIKNKLIKIPTSMDITFIEKLSNVLNEKLSGLSIDQINLVKQKNSVKIREIQSQLGANPDVLLPILDSIADSISDIEQAELFLKGITNIFNFPEYNDIKKAKNFLNFLYDKQNLYNLISATKHESEIQVIIGDENELLATQNCSLIIATYSISDDAVGTIGVIGPTRMEYSKIISSLSVLTKKINQVLTELYNR